MFTVTKILPPSPPPPPPPGLPDLGALIRCAQNRYTAVQTDLKYPLRRHAKKKLNTEYMK